MKKLLSKEVRIAIVAGIAIVILFVGMNFLKGVLVFSNDNSYKVYLKDIKGLSVSSPIYANGYKVGTVSDILFDYSGTQQDGMEVDLDIDNRMHIPVGTTAEVVSDIMGNVQMNLHLAAPSGKFIENGGTLTALEQKGTLDKAAEMIPKVEAMLPKIDSILVSVNTLLADPAIAGTLHNAEVVTANLKTSTADLNRLMAQINQQVPGIMSKADKTMANAQQLTNNLAQIDVAGTMAQVNSTLSNVNAFTAKLNSQEGTMGKFLNDPSVYDNLNATMRDADSLMVDLKSHPKRYVHFSIFGKKDK